MCFERYFLINQIADFALIAAVTRGLGCFRLGRATLASTLCAAYAVLARLQPAMASPSVQLALLIPMAMLSTGRSRGCAPAAAGVSLTATALASGSCIERLGATGFSPWLLLLPWVLSIGPRLRIAALSAPRTAIEIVCRGRTARFPACIDTGNRLTEPLSGQPVLIASRKLLDEVLPECGFRRVAYGAVGGGGELQCFCPDGLYILRNGHRRRAPDAWVAIYPATLPGAFQALAPAAFALNL